MQSLPKEILCEIACFLDFEDVIRLRLTASSFNEALCSSAFGGYPHYELMISLSDDSNENYVQAAKYDYEPIINYYLVSDHKINTYEMGLFEMIKHNADVINLNEYLIDISKEPKIQKHYLILERRVIPSEEYLIDSLVFRTWFYYKSSPLQSNKEKIIDQLGEAELIVSLFIILILKKAYKEFRTYWSIYQKRKEKHMHYTYTYIYDKNDKLTAEDFITKVESIYNKKYIDYYLYGGFKFTFDE